jgi:hypothetical protein
VAGIKGNSFVNLRESDQSKVLHRDSSDRRRSERVQCVSSDSSFVTVEEKTLVIKYGMERTLDSDWA